MQTCILGQQSFNTQVLLKILLNTYYYKKKTPCPQYPVILAPPFRGGRGPVQVGIRRVGNSLTPPTRGVTPIAPRDRQIGDIHLKTNLV